MTRKIIAFEGKEVVPGQILKLGALKWLDDEIPVTDRASFGGECNLLGRATDFRREEDGAITAEIDCDIPEDAGVTVYCTDVKANRGETPLIVQSARIRMIFTTTEVPWAGGWKGEDG